LALGKLRVRTPVEVFASPVQLRKRVLVVDDSTTIRKVVSGILERHGYEAVPVAEAQVALEALQQIGNTFDLVLVDFVMPKMNGFQFCRELRKTDVGKALPVVLMSAKSDKIRDKFVLQTGAVDAITKPFDAQALLALIEHALDRIDRGRVPETAESDSDAVREPSSPPSLDEVDSAASPLALSGDLGGIPIGAVMQLLQMEALSGVLLVTKGESQIRIVMRKGLVDRVESRGASDEFRIGRFFVEAGLVTPVEIESLIRPPSPDDSDGASRPRLGDMLLRTGKITEAQLKSALAQQSSELIYDVLRWSKGRFELRPALSERDRQEPRLALPVASVVMEGFRRVDEWRLIEKKVGSFDEVLVADAVALAALGEDAMTKQERTVLEAIDSQRTLREVVSASHMSSFDACKIVCQFLEARLVRRRVAA
jgi:CheY-like chemotaxis protein